jgi:tetratricopeptide (TPR) repeat protein
MALAACCGAASAQSEPVTSSLDAPLFYQLLIGEMELSAGRAGNAYEVILDAAKRHNDVSLYQRAVEIALQARAGEQALTAARAWGQAFPRSADAPRFQTQILLALNRPEELDQPLATWLANSPADDRPGLISALPRLLQRVTDRAQASALLTKALAAYADKPPTRTASLVAVGRMALAAGQAEQALALATQAAADAPDAPGPTLLALEMLPAPAAEDIVTKHLARPGAEPAVRLAYVRALTSAQRYTEAIGQLELITKARPELPEPWLTLGALHVELKHAKEAEQALQRFVQLAGTEKTAPVQPADEDDESGAAHAAMPAGRDFTQAWLLLAQAAELRGDLKAAESWLAKVDNPQRALEVQSRRAGLLARQGQIKQARALIQAVPERTGDDARSKLLAEAQMLRDVKRWREAAEVLTTANQRYANDVDLIYEQAMVEEKLDRFAEMERLLRRVMELKPDHPHAHNALGYSLADRNQRLTEARELISKALTMAPGDPFITDSMAWVEYRMGNRDEALKLLRQAYQARPDTEIGAHLGEVLWSLGQRDEAKRIWVEGRRRDASNEVLRETLARLKVGL